jgi:PAP2 superfamily
VLVIGTPVAKYRSCGGDSLDKMKAESPAPVFEYAEGSQSPPASAAASARASRKFLDDPDYILRAWAVILIVAAIDWVWAGHAGFRITGIRQAAPAVAMLAAVGFLLDYTGRMRPVSDALQYCALWISFAVALEIYSYVAATLCMPLRDAQFALMDRALGFNWTAGFIWIESLSGAIRSILSHAYNSLFVQVFGSIGYFAMIRRSDRNRELLWMGMLSALITTSISGLLPALGPYLNGDMPAWSAVLMTIRAGSLSNLELAKLTGIVTFPSFHTALAVIFVYVHRPPLRSFVPMAILNVLMVVAIPFAGHHYLVDVIAGAAVAAVSIAIVRAAMRPRSLARLEVV